MTEPEQTADHEPDQTPDAQPPEPTWTRFDVNDPDQREAALAAAAAAVRAGNCIVLPTDTVYGIGARAQDAAAVTGLLEAKKRGRDMPPPVLVADRAMVDALVAEMPDGAEQMAIAYWPGPLTLILKAQDGLSMDLGDAEGTIAVRVPDHDFTRTLLRRTGPLAVSSANVSGQPSSTTIDEAIEQLGNSVSIYLDAGSTPGHEPSSIVDFVTSEWGEMVRLGALDDGLLRAYAPMLKWNPPAVEVLPEPEVDQAAEVEPVLAGEAEQSPDDSESHH